MGLFVQESKESVGTHAGGPDPMPKKVPDKLRRAGVAIRTEDIVRVVEDVSTGR